MKNFLRFYKWALDVKLDMAIYTIALIFIKCLAEAFCGVYTVNSLTLLQMLLVGFALAFIQHGFFPADKDFTPAQLRGRTIGWAIASNIVAISCAVLLNWFSGFAPWVACVLVFALQAALAAMWVGIHIAGRVDTKQLNQSLQNFKNK
ncbi:MAG: hypothetical protein PHG02_02530 [Oscillospiraceae bacterium]|nr:hypothetical protein [Oscillospiraceae bacterium]